VRQVHCKQESRAEHLSFEFIFYGLPIAFAVCMATNPNIPSTTRPAAVTSFPRREQERARTRGFIIAWSFALVFYFLEYAVRPSPSVMVPQLATAFGTTALGVSSILGVYYYTYSVTSLVVAFPGRQVISMSGDGGLAMLMGELVTVMQHDLPTKIVVFNNSVLGMVKLEMEAAGFPDWQTDNKNPNFTKLAEAIGFNGMRIEDPGDVRSGLKKALESSEPALIDVVTDPNALSMPSHITAEQVKGFGITMMKLVLSGHIDEVVETVEGNIRNI